MPRASRCDDEHAVVSEQDGFAVAERFDRAPSFARIADRSVVLVVQRDVVVNER